MSRGGGDLKERLYRLLCFVCAFVISLSLSTVPVCADDYDGQKASVFAYALNNEMLRYGVVTTEECGGYLDIDRGAGIYPAGVIYADMIDFDNNQSPYLVIFRADSERGCASADIYKYDDEKKEASLVGIISKGYNIGESCCGEMTIGYNDTERYIIYNEYRNGEKVTSEFFTVVNGTAFRYVTAPEYANESGVLSFTPCALHPEVDVSAYNYYLGEFFSGLKNASADSVTYEDICDTINLEESEKIEYVLKKAAKLNAFDIGEYSTMERYSKALEKNDGTDAFYSVTNLYDLGEQLYYVRFATNRSFYNYAILRRTSVLEEGYQLLNVRCDSIPLSDIELDGFKNAYMHNKLVLKKARGNVCEKPEKESVNALSIPKPISRDLRKPMGLIGGGVCLILFVAFWIYIGSEDE